jgi:hypothetical protein
MLANAYVATRLPSKGSRTCPEVLFGKARVGARRGEARGPSIPMPRRLLRAVRLRRVRCGHPHSNGVGRSTTSRPQSPRSEHVEVVFAEYDAPGLKTINGVADIEGNYPSKGVGERGAWFRDSEGNLLGIGQTVRR